MGQVLVLELMSPELPTSAGSNLNHAYHANSLNLVPACFLFTMVCQCPSLKKCLELIYICIYICIYISKSN